MVSEVSVLVDLLLCSWNVVMAKTVAKLHGKAPVEFSETDYPRIEYQRKQQQFWDSVRLSLFTLAIVAIIGITIGIVTHFVVEDDKSFYYLASFQVTNIKYKENYGIRSSREFIERSHQIERMQWIAQPSFQRALPGEEEMLLTEIEKTDQTVCLHRPPPCLQLPFYTIDSKKMRHLLNSRCGIRMSSSNMPLPASSTTERIVQGRETAMEGEWPWQASLQLIGAGHQCGATLISNTWLLTAAHCFWKNRDPSKWIATFGTTIKPPAVKRSVGRIIIHEDYHRESNENDIALAQLTTRVEFSNVVQRVCLPDSSMKLPPKTSVFVTGFGSIVDDGPTQNKLRQARVETIGTDVCNRKEVYDGLIMPGMLCAGFMEGKVDACKGDSGGPLVYDNRDIWYIVGIVSWGQSCALPNKPGVYTRVTKYRDWITSKTGI
nr:transmembrane protease serine 11F [Meriones unguiculatus]